MIYQDMPHGAERIPFVLRAVRDMKASAEFRRALEAERYFRGENVSVSRKTVLQPRKLDVRDETGRRRTRCVMEDVVGNRIASGFFFRAVCQQNQYLLQNGVMLPTEARRRLGAAFDERLERLSERALVQGSAFGYWNGHSLEVLEIARDPLSGFIPLWDELTGRLRAGIQFWQTDREHDLLIRLFTEEEVSVYRVSQNDSLTVISRTVITGLLPVIPLFANGERRSELTPSLRSKIDAYDRILSDFADNLDRANDVYWVLNNFGGTSDEIAAMLAEISRVKAVASLSDGTGNNATAEPKTIQVPYQARRAALDLLERELYKDAMALDTQALTGGSLTNVAIRVACANLDLKCDRYEWQLISFMQALLELLGIRDAEIRFQRQTIANDTETVNAIYTMRQDIDRRTALKLNPFLQSEEVDELCRQEKKKSPSTETGKEKR